jgi:hypothetical protein
MFPLSTIFFLSIQNSCEVSVAIQQNVSNFFINKVWQGAVALHRKKNKFITDKS